MAELVPSVPLTLTLRYTHPLGALAPYFRGLEQGRAVASRCTTCGRTWFPPRLSCPAHGTTNWVELSGRGRVVSVTVTDSVLPFTSVRARHVFALIALDGAENHAFGRIAGAPAAACAGLVVRLMRAAGTWPHPAQAAWFVVDE